MMNIILNPNLNVQTFFNQLISKMNDEKHILKINQAYKTLGFDNQVGKDEVLEAFKRLKRENAPSKAVEYKNPAAKFTSIQEIPKAIDDKNKEFLNNSILAIAVRTKYDPEKKTPEIEDYKDQLSLIANFYKKIPPGTKSEQKIIIIKDFFIDMFEAITKKSKNKDQYNSFFEELKKNCIEYEKIDKNLIEKEALNTFQKILDAYELLSKNFSKPTASTTSSETTNKIKQWAQLISSDKKSDFWQDIIKNTFLLKEELTQVVQNNVTLSTSPDLNTILTEITEKMLSLIGLITTYDPKNNYNANIDYPISIEKICTNFKKKIEADLETDSPTLKSSDFKDKILELELYPNFKQIYEQFIQKNNTSNNTLTLFFHGVNAILKIYKKFETENKADAKIRLAIFKEFNGYKVYYPIDFLLRLRNLIITKVIKSDVKTTWDKKNINALLTINQALSKNTSFYKNYLTTEQYSFDIKDVNENDCSLVPVLTENKNDISSIAKILHFQLLTRIEQIDTNYSSWDFTAELIIKEEKIPEKEIDNAITFHVQHFLKQLDTTWIDLNIPFIPKDPSPLKILFQINKGQKSDYQLLIAQKIAELHCATMKIIFKKPNTLEEAEKQLFQTFKEQLTFLTDWQKGKMEKPQEAQKVTSPPEMKKPQSKTFEEIIPDLKNKKNKDLLTEIQNNNKSFNQAIESIIKNKKPNTVEQQLLKDMNTILAKLNDFFKINPYKYKYCNRLKKVFDQQRSLTQTIFNKENLKAKISTSDWGEEDKPYIIIFSKHRSCLKIIQKLQKTNLDDMDKFNLFKTAKEIYFSIKPKTINPKNINKEFNKLEKEYTNWGDVNQVNINELKEKNLSDTSLRITNALLAQNNNETFLNDLYNDKKTHKTNRLYLIRAFIATKMGYKDSYMVKSKEKYSCQDIFELFNTYYKDKSPSKDQSGSVLYDTCCFLIQKKFFPESFKDVCISLLDKEDKIIEKNNPFVFRLLADLAIKFKEPIKVRINDTWFEKHLENQKDNFDILTDLNTAGIQKWIDLDDYKKYYTLDDSIFEKITKTSDSFFANLLDFFLKFKLTPDDMKKLESFSKIIDYIITQNESLEKINNQDDIFEKINEEINKKTFIAKEIRFSMNPSEIESNKEINKKIEKYNEFVTNVKTLLTKFTLPQKVKPEEKKEEIKIEKEIRGKDHKHKKEKKKKVKKEPEEEIEIEEKDKPTVQEKREEEEIKIEEIEIKEKVKSISLEDLEKISDPKELLNTIAEENKSFSKKLTEIITQLEKLKKTSLTPDFKKSLQRAINIIMKINNFIELNPYNMKNFKNLKINFYKSSKILPKKWKFKKKAFKLQGKFVNFSNEDQLLISIFNDQLNILSIASKGKLAKTNEEKTTFFNQINETRKETHKTFIELLSKLEYNRDRLDKTKLPVNATVEELNFSNKLTNNELFFIPKYDPEQNELTKYLSTNTYSIKLNTNQTTKIPKQSANKNDFYFKITNPNKDFNENIQALSVSDFFITQIEEIAYNYAESNEENEKLLAEDKEAEVKSLIETIEKMFIIIKIYDYAIRKSLIKSLITKTMDSSIDTSSKMLIIQQILIKFFKNDSSLWTLSKKITQSDYLDNYVKKLKTTDLQTLLTNTLTHLENTDAGRSILAYLEMLKRKPAQIEKKQESITTFTNEYVKDPKTSLAPLFILLVDFAYVNKILGDKDLKDKLTNLINRFEPVDKDIKKKIKKIQTEEREEEEIKIKEKKSEEPKTAPLQKKPTESIKELQNKLKEACETIDKENDKEKKEKLIVTLEEVLNEFAEKIKEDPNKTSLVLETCYELIDIDEEDITNIIKNAFMATFKDVINDDFFNCMSLLKNNTLNIMAMGYNYYNNISTILEKINTIKNLEITAFFKKKFEQLKITTNLIKLFINSKNKRMKEEQEILHAFVQNYTSWLLNKEEIEEYKNKLKKEYMSQDKNSNSENINDIFVPISKKTENPPKKPELEEKEEIEIEEKKPIDPLSTALSLLKAKLLSLAKSLQED